MTPAEELAASEKLLFSEGDGKTSLGNALLWWVDSRIALEEEFIHAEFAVAREDAE